MKIFECPKCGSKDVFIDKTNKQTGLYCGDCGRWIKWINKDEQRLAERQIEMMHDSVVMELVNNLLGGKHE